MSSDVSLQIVSLRTFASGS